MRLMATITYKCPNCDGGLLFDPDSQKFHCEYCLSYFTEEELKKASPASADSRTENPAADPRASSPQPGTQAVVYSCPSCGAEVIAEETTASTFCYYCHNPVVLSGKLDGALRPDFVVPFVIDREEAVRRFQDWITRKKFVPKAFFSQEQIEKLSGVYFPYWTADVRLTGGVQGVGTRVRVWRSGDTEFTEKRFYDLIREGTIVLEDLTASALSKANRKLVEGVQPFDDSQKKAFQIPYLLGFQAEKRDIEKEAVEPAVREQSLNYSRDLLNGSMTGYTTITQGPLRVDSFQSDWHYTLFPVWVLTYRSRTGTIHYYAMNGQTGKVCGKLPVDLKKLGFLFGGIFLSVLLLCLLGGWFL